MRKWITELLSALGFALILGGIGWWVAYLLSGKPPPCVLLTDAQPFNLVIRDGRFMLCRPLSDESIDVVCRVLEEKPCR
jgi:hypothetical protein